jgi:hypothetical protein
MHRTRRHVGQYCRIRRWLRGCWFVVIVSGPVLLFVHVSVRRVWLFAQAIALCPVNRQPGTRASRVERLTLHLPRRRQSIRFPERAPNALSSPVAAERVRPNDCP